MKTPFGSTDAAITLAKIVENDRRSRRYVSSTLSEFNHLLVVARQMNDYHISRYVYNLIRDEFLQRIEATDKPLEIKSYLKNVLISHFRKHVKSLEYRGEKMIPPLK